MHEGARAVSAGMNSMEFGARHRQDGCRYVAEWLEKPLAGGDAGDGISGSSDRSLRPNEHTRRM